MVLVAIANCHIVTMVSPTQTSFGEAASSKPSVNGVIARAKQALTENKDSKAADEKARPAINARASIREQIEAAQRAFLDDEVKKNALEAYKLDQSEKVFAQLKKELGVEAYESLKKEKYGDVVADLKAEHREKVLQELKDELRASATMELKKELTNDVVEILKNELRDEVKASNEAGILAELRKELHRKVEADLRDEMADKVWDDLRAEYAPQVARQIREENLEEEGSQAESVRGEKEENGDEEEDDEEDEEEFRGRPLFRAGSSGPNAATDKEESLFFNGEDDYVQNPFTTGRHAMNHHHGIKRSRYSSLSPDFDEEELDFSTKRQHLEEYEGGDAQEHYYANGYDEEGEEEFREEVDEESEEGEEEEGEEADEEAGLTGGESVHNAICLDDSDEE